MAFLRYVAFAFTLVFSLQVHADYPASQSWLASWPGGADATGSSCEGALSAWFAQFGGTNSGSPCPNSGDFCQTTNARRCYGTVAPLGMTCPNGGTLSGNTCVHSCPPGQIENPDGTCVSECTQRSQAAPTYAWFKSSVGGPSVEGSYCDGRCMVGLNPAATGTAYNNGKEKIQRYEVVVTAAPCTSANIPTAAPQGSQPPEPPKRPLCDANEGVLTSTSGTIACVPAGTPTASVPEIRKFKTTDQFPDGSTKITETTLTKDPVSQVQDTKQVITNTPASGGGQGQAGPVGTQNSQGTANGTSGGNPIDPKDNGSSDLCKNNPGLQICKGGMNEEATQKQVRDALQGDGDYSAISNANGDAKKTEADAAHQAHLDTLTNGTFDSSTSTQKQSVSDIIGSWWEPVPMSGCTPYTATIGSRSWTLDICPIAEKISTVSGYAMWVFLAFGVLGLFVKRGAE